MYVGPHDVASLDRADGYWNAPFGALLARDDLLAASDAPRRSSTPAWSAVALTYSDIGIYGDMARTPTTTDAFNAVAEASRRDLLDAIGTGEVTVNELVERLGLSQPQVSKHLAVLRQVGVVLVRKDGRHRWYRVNGPVLQPIHDWVSSFERTWNARLDRLDDLLVELEHRRKPQ